MMEAIKDQTKESCRDFIAVLASSRPAPGGGGAAALVGAIGTALANMVASLTLGKKKYADIEEEIKNLISECEALELQLLDQVKADEEGFMPLADAYAISKDDPSRQEIMEKATVKACDVPLHIMELCCRAIDIAEILAAKGSKLALSDAGCAAVCLRAALEAASLNVYINTKAMLDQIAAADINARSEAMLSQYCPKCEDIYTAVRNSFLDSQEAKG